MYSQPGFLDSMFLLPEGNVKFRFQDIPRWAAAAKKYGVKTVGIEIDPKVVELARRNVKSSGVERLVAALA